MRRVIGAPSGDEPLVPWREIPNKSYRIRCDHGLGGDRTEIGGVAIDQLYDLTGESLYRSSSGEVMPMPCPTCKATWLVPVDAVDKLVRDRGDRPGATLVTDIPGVAKMS